MVRFRVVSKQFAYPVIVGRGAWRGLRSFAREGYTSVFVLTEQQLWHRWGRLFLGESRLGRVCPICVSGGEQCKSLDMVERVATRLLRGGADRGALLVAFGGGVVGDLAGFVASTYMRGIDLIHVPTTVVSQVDSSIGGKTGVNVGAMKNLVGTFYPPRQVAADPVVLSSLSGRAFRSGLYEVVKHGILSGEKFFYELENQLDSLRPDALRNLEPVLARAAKVKVDVVNRDERESRLRMVLNLGHTLGHALEEAMGYRGLLHGEAVGWGLLGVIRLGVQLGLTKAPEAQRMARLVRRVGPLPSIREVKAAEIIKLLPQDKKTLGGQIHWVIPEKIGKVRITTDVPLAQAAAAFRDIQSAGPHE